MATEHTDTSVNSSHLDTTGQQLFELRFDRVVSPAAAQALACLYRGSGPADAGLWRQYRVPPPAGFWGVASGRDMPALVSLYAWPGLNHREETLGRLLACDDGRDRMQSLTRGTESWILIESPASMGLVGKAKAPSPGCLCEMRIDRVLNGAGREAAATLCENEFAATGSLGGRLLGLYELAIGPDRPVLVSLMEWRHEASPHASWSTLDGAEAEQRRFQERRQYGRRLFIGCEQYFMVPLPTSWPSQPG